LERGGMKREAVLKGRRVEMWNENLYFAINGSTTNSTITE